MSGVEFGVARILELVRPRLERVELGVSWRCSQPLRVEARAKALERIALGAAVDVRERLQGRLQRPVRLDLIGQCRKAAGIARDIARLDNRQRRAVLVHSPRRPRENRPIPRAIRLDHSVAIEGAPALEGLLFRFRRDR